MLKIFNDLAFFFEDRYRRISVREYAKMMKISPPTASKVLTRYQKEGLLQKVEDRRYHLYYAQKENRQFIDFSRLYWRIRLEPFLKYLEQRLLSPPIILFGSLAKAEAKNDSDIDLAIIAPKREIDIKPFEKNLKRPFQLFWFDTLADLKSEGLRDNIVNGYILSGRLALWQIGKNVLKKES